MSSTSPKSSVSLLDDSWLMESVRISFFLSDQRAMPDFFKLLIGHVPSDVMEKPQQGVRQETSDFGSGQIIVAQSPGRIDIIHCPKEPSNTNPNAPPPGIVYVGELKSGLEIGLSLINKAIQIQPNLSRLAWSPIVVKAASSFQDAAEKLYRYNPKLPINTDSDREIFWQINSRRASRSFKGYVNNVKKWNTGLSQIFFMQPGTNTPISSVNSQHFVRAEFDVNTDAEDPIIGISKDDISLACKELLDICAENFEA